MDWPTHPNLDWEYFTQVFEKTRVFLWSHAQPFTKNGDQCLIYYNPFRQGVW